MVGRAGPLLAKRSLSALIVAAFVMSSLAGFALMDNSVHSEAQPIGDLIVTDGTYVIENLDQLVDGNVEVRDDGVLIIRDGSLSVISNYDQRHSVTIGADGVLIMDHGVLTTYLNQINPWAELDLLIEDGGQLIATNGSMLRFPGTMTLLNGAEVTLRDSTITSLDGAMVSQYVVGSSGLITGDSANDGPEILVISSTLNLFDSTIDALPEFPADGAIAGNLTLSGTSTMLAVNSHISVDFGPALGITDWYVHNVLVVNDQSHVYLYGTSFAPYAGAYADRAPAIVTSGLSTTPAVALTQGGDDDTGQPLGDLALIDSLTYEVEAQETMELDTWDNGTTDGGLSVSSATIMVTYSVAADYAGTNAFQWAPDGAAYTSTTIVPSAADLPGTVATYELSIASLPTVDDVCDMDFRFINNGGVGTGAVEIDQIWVMFTVGGDAYIFRWLNATVGDEYGVPIAGASIDATFTGSTEYEGQDAFYSTSEGISTSPDPLVLDYLGETDLTLRVTDEDGSAQIPYMTDMILSDGSSNSLFVGSYAVTGSTTIESVVHSSAESLSFEAYPSMTPASQSREITVEIMGISESSPDFTRWLVVPIDESTPTFTIENISYYHAGDVIVASDGELIFRNAEFLLVQETANERTIYVDGNGVLTFDNTIVTSTLPIDLIVQGSGTLYVLNSEMHGVDIVAKENARVILEGSTMDGTIYTSWDSAAIIEVSDSTLSETPVLSGASEGSFTNVSIPSITVEDDAVAYIYRWIHVTVFDGNMMPLPNALVTARFYISQEIWTSKLSNPAGIAQLPCLGTILTSTGSSFVGNYRVNATLWDGATEYVSDQEVSVGVKPYVEPLGTNATYTWLTISSALPDLTIAAEGAVTSDPLNPMNGEVTQIIASVENIGVAVAYNVPVDFSEYGSVFASVICPRIDPGTTVEVIADWTAREPLSPDEHTIRVDVDPYNVVLEQDDALAIGYGYVTVLNLPDLEVVAEGGMYSVPSDIIVDTPCELGVTVWNVGDNDAFSINVSFYMGSLDLVSPDTLIAWSVVGSIEAGGAVDALGSWTPTSVGTFLISVVVDGANDIFEIDETNNNGTTTVRVFDHPDLELQDLQYTTESTTTTIAGGDTVTVSARVINLEPAPVFDPEVALYLNSTSGEPYSTENVMGEFRLDGLSSWVTFEYTAPMVNETIYVTLYLVVNPYHTVVEQDYDNNEVSVVFEVTDVRPDLIVTSDDIIVFHNDAEVDGAMFGRSVNITVNVTNPGARGVEDFFLSVRIASSLLNYSIGNTTGTVLAGSSVEVSVSWVVSLVSTGNFTLYVSVDPENEFIEQSESNNHASRAFTITPLDIVVSVLPSKNEYETGSTINLIVTVTYSGGTVPVVGFSDIVIALYDPDGDIVAETLSDGPLITNSAGQINGYLMPIPTELETGQYTVQVTIQGETYSSGSISITGDVSGGGIPLMVWLVVIIVIVAVVGAFTLYTYKYGLGKLVECGECGAFIPAASKRCPKCGVEFEAGTMKCSECGAWVPAEATECSGCGVKFVGEEKLSDEDYLERMKAEYEEMVSKYRELAKPELGKKFSEKKFDEWWMTQPTYVSFEDWLAKEEEKRKEGPVPCPVCGTLNPKEATVCHKCGTVFGSKTVASSDEESDTPPEMPPEMPPAQGMDDAEPSPSPDETPRPAAPKMVIRRPIDRKVVPKKIIRAPVNTKNNRSEDDRSENGE